MEVFGLQSKRGKGDGSFSIHNVQHHILKQFVLSDASSSACGLGNSSLLPVEWRWLSVPLKVTALLGSL
jgi:hypothetical protein